MRARVQATVRAPASHVRELFADYRRWPDVFPMISAARRADGPPDMVTVLVGHRRDGEVINRLTAGHES